MTYCEQYANLQYTYCSIGLTCVLTPLGQNVYGLSHFLHPSQHVDQCPGSEVILWWTSKNLTTSDPSDTFILPLYTPIDEHINLDPFDIKQIVRPPPWECRHFERPRAQGCLWCLAFGQGAEGKFIRRLSFTCHCVTADLLLICFEAVIH